MRLKDKVCIVTGSRKGIGAAIAQRLLEEGALVVVHSRWQDKAEEAARSLREQGFEKVDFFACDVADQQGVHEMMQYVYGKYGAIDVLVNNAGVNKIVSSYDLDMADFRSVLDTNLVGPMICCQEAGKIMRDTGGGSIVNIASVFSQVYIGRRIPYATSKTALLALTKVLAMEWAEDNIRVTAVAPGWLKTDMNTAKDGSGGYTDADIIARTPLHRYGDVRDIANAVLFLASDEAQYITGTCLNVDGGWISYGGWCR